MIPSSGSILLLSALTILVYLGFGQRILDRMRLTTKTALIVLILMIIGHFLPTIPLGATMALNLGALIPLGVVFYLLATTSRPEQVRALGVSFLTTALIVITDKVLPPDPGLLDPVFSGGIFAGLISYAWGRSRRSAFIAGILGVLLADVAALIQLRTLKVPQRIVFGSGGLFSSVIISPFLAVLIAEIIGEVLEFFHRKGRLREGGDGGA